METGLGMGATLRIANEKNAYTLSDIGTFLKYRRENLIDLESLIEENKELLNVYSVMIANPTKYPWANFEVASKFAEFLVSENGQRAIEAFGKEEYGRSLFLPAAKVLENGSEPVASWIKDLAFIDNSECPEHLRFGRSDLYE